MKEVNTYQPKFYTSPLRTRTNILFTSLTTLFFLLVNFFPDSNFFHWIIIRTTPNKVMVLGFIPLNIWFIVALIMGIGLPLLLLIIHKFRQEIRILLLPYVLVFAVQVITELILTKKLFPGFALFSGLLYTLYRIWQLQAAIYLQRAKEKVPSFVRSFLSTAAGFWILNFVFLLSVLFFQ